MEKTIKDSTKIDRLCSYLNRSGTAVDNGLNKQNTLYHYNCCSVSLNIENGSDLALCVHSDNSLLEQETLINLVSISNGTRPAPIMDKIYHPMETNKDISILVPREYAKKADDLIKICTENTDSFSRYLKDNPDIKKHNIFNYCKKLINFYPTNNISEMLIDMIYVSLCHYLNLKDKSNTDPKFSTSMGNIIAVMLNNDLMKKVLE